jgi:hypothetical protein
MQRNGRERADDQCAADVGQEHGRTLPHSVDGCAEPQRGDCTGCHFGDAEDAHLERCRREQQRGDPRDGDAAQHRAEIGHGFAGQEAAKALVGR